MLKKFDFLPLHELHFPNRSMVLGYHNLKNNDRMMRKGETHTEEKQINHDYIIMNGDAMGGALQNLVCHWYTGLLFSGKEGWKI